MDDVIPVVDSRLRFVPNSGNKLTFSRTQQLHQWLLSTSHCLHTVRTNLEDVFIVTAETTTTHGEVHVHFMEKSIIVANLHWRMDATKFTLRIEMPPRTSPKLQQSERIVCKISRRRTPSHDAQNSNQVLAPPLSDFPSSYE